MIIDTHCHIYFDKFSDDLEEVIARAQDAGVEKMISIGCNLESSRKALDLASRYEGIYATVGLHPCDVKAGMGDGVLDDLEKLIVESEKVVAVGECGLDYFKGADTEDARGLQKAAFEAQIKLAQKMDLPLVVHNREADEDCFDILKKMDVKRVVFHCFGSDLTFAKKVWEEGWITSFTGILTYPNAQKLVDVARNVPMDLFMVETDCPYLAPQSHRGQRNEPSYVVDVVDKLAELMGLSFEEVAKISTDNARRFFSKLG